VKFVLKEQYETVFNEYKEKIGKYVDDAGLIKAIANDKNIKPLSSEDVNPSPMTVMAKNIDSVKTAFNLVEQKIDKILAILEPKLQTNVVQISPSSASVIDQVAKELKDEAEFVKKSKK